MTTVVSLDPMYAYFDMDEPHAAADPHGASTEGKIVAYGDKSDIPVLMGLQSEDGYPHRGTINFVNNQVNSTTGSIPVRGVFPNPSLQMPPSTVVASSAKRIVQWTRRPFKPGHERAEDLRLLSPGMFVRIRLPIGQPHPALLIIDRAIAV